MSVTHVFYENFANQTWPAVGRTSGDSLSGDSRQIFTTGFQAGPTFPTIPTFPYFLVVFLLFPTIL